MNISSILLELIDNGGRRLCIERRQFSYLLYFPERRMNGERRRLSLSDQRKVLDRRNDRERRSSEVEADALKKSFLECRRKREDRRCRIERRAAFAAARATA